ncbi:MAG TPA: pitrilysin family protein [Thermohalobaculum sp.]|nr:pitrilysin family protein [Thermohalobaculum sp.]
MAARRRRATRLALLALLALMLFGTAPARAVEIAEVTSPAGQVFWMVEEPAIPIVALEISFAGGARLDPEGRAGLARMVMGLLDEGAGEHDAVAFATRRDELAARFSFDAGRDAVRVSAQMLVETLGPSVDLLATALAAPRFDPAAVERVRGQLLSQIAEDRNDPGAVAGRAWSARAFPGHPYGTPVEGTLESVAAITGADLASQHRRLLTRANARIAVVGAIGPDEAGRLVDTLLAGLDAGAPLEPPPAGEAPPPGIEVIPLDVPQSAAVFGHAGIARADPDFIPAYLMNYVLGGAGLTSRLMQEVRNKRGLAYGAHAFLVTYQGASLYLGNVRTENARIAESLEVIRAEWARMAAEGATAEELETAKRYLTGAFPLNIDSNAKIANYLVFMQEEDLGIDYMDRRKELIEAVTLEDVRRVAARLLDAQALSIVVVGQPEGL